MCAKTELSVLKPKKIFLGDFLVFLIKIKNNNLHVGVISPFSRKQTEQFGVFNFLGLPACKKYSLQKL